MAQSKALLKVGMIQQRILRIRGEKVIMDADLAEAFGVPTRRLNEKGKSNRERFPEDLMSQLPATGRAEVVAMYAYLEKLKSSTTLRHEFVEHGAIMAASG